MACGGAGAEGGWRGERAVDRPVGRPAEQANGRPRAGGRGGVGGVGAAGGGVRGWPATRARHTREFGAGGWLPRQWQCLPGADARGA